MGQEYAEEGFVLLKLDSSLRYRGIDREPFEPAIIEDELNIEATASSDIWAMYPAGWRRDAYRLFSENQQSGPDEIVSLRSVEAAQAILRLLPSSLGAYEIVKYKIQIAQSKGSKTLKPEETILGYDIAYPGGDYYSAVRNGLHTNPNNELLGKYSAQINQYGLFDDPQQAAVFLLDFRKLVPSETGSTFIIYELRSQAITDTVVI